MVGNGFRRNPGAIGAAIRSPGARIGAAAILLVAAALLAGARIYYGAASLAVADAVRGTFLLSCLALSAVFVVAGFARSVVLICTGALCSLALIGIVNLIVIDVGGAWLDRQRSIAAVLDGATWGLATLAGETLMRPTRTVRLSSRLVILALVHAVSQLASNATYGPEVFLDGFGNALRAGTAVVVILLFTAAEMLRRGGALSSWLRRDRDR